MTLDPWHILTANFAQAPKPYTAFVTLLDMVLYFVVMLKAAMARRKYSVIAPSTDGPHEFLVAFRVQMNMLEQMALHLPLLWIAAMAMDDVFAALLGFIWLFGRILYSIRYAQKPTRRKKGFAIAMLANIGLFAGGMAGTIASF